MGRAEPSPGADVGRLSAVPAQSWEDGWGARLGQRLRRRGCMTERSWRASTPATGRCSALGKQRCCTKPARPKQRATQGVHGKNIEEDQTRPGDDRASKQRRQTNKHSKQTSEQTNKHRKQTNKQANTQTNRRTDAADSSASFVRFAGKRSAPWCPCMYEQQ